jgi:hypothetical protein
MRKACESSSSSSHFPVVLAATVLQKLRVRYMREVNWDMCSHTLVVRRLTIPT